MSVKWIEDGPSAAATDANLDEFWKNVDWSKGRRIEVDEETYKWLVAQIEATEESGDFPFLIVQPKAPGHSDEGEFGMEEKIVTVTTAEIRERHARGEGKTDWARVDAMTDAEIEEAIKDDPDWAGFEDIDWSKATIVRPKRD